MRSEGETVSRPEHRHRHDARGWKGFCRHYLEMVLAMMPGCVLGCMAWSALLNTWWDSSGISTILMVLLMAATMAIWMGRRSHRRRDIIEMSASMFVVPILLLPAFWAGSISSLTIHGLTMISMLPAMLAVMIWRRRTYLA